MKRYNLKNYIRYKDDLKRSMPKDAQWNCYTREQLIIKLMPLVENIARGFSMADRASGILSINDVIQEGNMALVFAVDRIDWNQVNIEDDIERQISGFVQKRIKGSIRRAIDMYRGNIKIPEHIINEVRKNTDEDKRMVRMFFNSVFESLDEKKYNNEKVQVPDTSKVYKTALLNAYILSLMKSCLDHREYEVIRMSYGLDCDKMQAKKIAKILNINGTADYVRISQIKREALDKLAENIRPDQVIDFLN